MPADIGVFAWHRDDFVVLCFAQRLISQNSCAVFFVLLFLLPTFALVVCIVNYEGGRLSKPENQSGSDTKLLP